MVSKLGSIRIFKSSCDGNQDSVMKNMKYSLEKHKFSITLKLQFNAIYTQSKDNLFRKWSQPFIPIKSFYQE